MANRVDITSKPKQITLADYGVFYLKLPVMTELTAMLKAYSSPSDEIEAVKNVSIAIEDYLRRALLGADMNSYTEQEHDDMDVVLFTALMHEAGAIMEDTAKRFESLKAFKSQGELVEGDSTKKQKASQGST